jgi:hypothetical protein
MKEPSHRVAQKRTYHKITFDVQITINTIESMEINL